MNLGTPGCFCLALQSNAYLSTSASIARVFFKPNPFWETNAVDTRCSRPFVDRGWISSHLERANVFPFTSFFAQKGHVSLLPRGTYHERIVNIKYLHLQRSQNRLRGRSNQTRNTKIQDPISTIQPGHRCPSHSRAVPTLLWLGFLPLRPKHALWP
jgi:hypothetical protein